MRAATCVVENQPCTCEAVRSDHWVKQPLGAYSSLPLVVIAAALCIASACKVNAPSFPRAWMMLLVSVGLGSFFFHSRLEFWAELWDFGMIYWICATLIARLIFKPRMSLPVAVVFLVTHAFFPSLRTVLAALCLVGGTWVFIAKKLSLKWIPYVAVFGMLSFALDRTLVFCNPTHWFQWHVVWHLALTAVLLGLSPIVGTKSLN